MEHASSKPVKRVVTPAVESMPADLLTPLAVFLALSSDAENCFLLESVEGGETLARYSFIGADPEMMVSGNDARVQIKDKNGSRVEQTPLFDFLRAHFDLVDAETVEDLPSFIGGAIGFLNFSAV